MCENMVILKIFLLLLGDFSEKRECLTDFWKKICQMGKNRHLKNAAPRGSKVFSFGGGWGC